tara:strand:- start:9885 stop:11075 length:1191 start_codon:yes stop_codon:yes gene_type:complete
MAEIVSASIFITNLNEDLVINPAIYKNIKSSIDVPENKQLTFTLQNLDVSIANSLRRVVLSEIPVVVLDSLDKENIEDENINIFKNTSILNNEIIKQRLTCIPVCINNIDEFEYKNYIIECDKTNNTNTKMIVSSGDFKIKNVVTGEYLPKSELEKIFKKNPVTNQYVDLVYLQPSFNGNSNESIKFECGFKVSNAKENGSYNAASTCVYSFTLDENEIEKQWKQMVEKLPQKKEIRELARNDFMNLEAQRITIPNSFDFKVQSVGIYENNELIILACEVMIRKFEQLIKYLETPEEIIHKNLELTENAYNVILYNEDYTIGKVLENMLYLQIFIKEKKLSYISMKKNHPHDKDSILMLAYNDETTIIDDIVVDITNICKMNIEIYQNIKLNMTKV